MKRSFTVRQGVLDVVEASLKRHAASTFERAPGELGVSTSAVSEAIRALERASRPCKVGVRGTRISQRPVMHVCDGAAPSSGVLAHWSFLQRQWS
jgi:hypothetical protein